MALRRLRETTVQPFRIIREAGPVRYPKDHKPVIETPVGGSMCLNCRFLGRDKKTCVSEEYIDYMGTNKLPLPANRMCSDWWRPRG